MRKGVWASRFAAALVALGAAGAASAAPLTLRLSDGANTVVVADNGVGDISAAVGAVTYAGGLGAFVVNVTTGVSYPLAGSPDFAQMFLNSVNVSSSLPAAGTLTIELSHTDFMTNGPTTFRADIGGFVSAVSPASIGYDTFLGADNALFSLGTPLTGLDFTGGAFAGGSTLVGENTVAPYSLTQVVTVGFPAGPATVSLDATLRVPEPATLSIFALVLALLGFTSRRRATRRS